MQGARVRSLVRELDPTCMLQLRVRMLQLRDPTCRKEDSAHGNKDPECRH